ncbi:response regulator transcription factor [Halosegnis marinus]|uniref:Response regulator transcription factor n=1 Tax=Halosegnis marinus TaxID=3034023 RepID=A0ABD5ZQ87_9EURY|nr:response regulator [Halosegnis sp. DT85]
MSDRPLVLVADDEPALAELYTVWLAGYETRTVHDGDAAVAAFDGTVDAAVLDRRMPGRSGAEVLEHVRSRRPACPVAMVTATDPDPEVAALGFDEYLLKPATREELRSLVESLLALPMHDDERRRYRRLSRALSVLREAWTPARLSGHDLYVDLRAELEALSAELDGRTAD